MTDALAHRGPDEEGYYQTETVAFGHRRLSIVDIAHGQQPMMNEDEQIVVICNGVIYNAPRLREALQKKGHLIKTHCDVEVIPHLYEEYGDDFCTYLEGMFALALFDRRRRRLVLARDHVGIKPLYYAAYEGRWAFASEIKALLEDPQLPRVLDYKALHDYLSLSYALPPRTFLRHVREVEPGTMLLIDEHGERTHTWWQPVFDPQPLSEAEALAMFEEILHQALQDHLLSDVPIGAFLSGGIDSSLIVGTLSQRLGVRPPTFTVGFGDAPYDEAPFAQAVAEQCRTDHHLLHIASGEADVELVQRIIHHFDQPFADSSAIPTYLICKEISKHVKVAFSGDGGDELFGGYPEFVWAPWLRRLGMFPNGLLEAFFQLNRWLNGSSDRGRQVSKALQMARRSAPEMIFGLHTYFGEDEKAALYRPEVIRRLNGYSSRHAYAAILRNASDTVFDQVTAARLMIGLHADMLRKVDMMSMAHSLEVRVPLLDRRMVEFACRVPARFKVRRFTSKYLLRKEAATMLPRHIARRPKAGFGIPLDTWANDAFIAFVRDVLGSSDAEIRQLIQPDKVSQIIDWFETGTYNPGQLSRYQVYQRLYQMLCLELWLRRCKPRLS